MRRSALHAFAIAALLIPGWAFVQGEPPAQEPAVRVFEALPNGGVIELQRASGDSAGMRTIRARLRGIAQALSAGDFAAPGYLHLAKQKEFAQPILTHLREVVHTACPDVEEAIKWGSPFFLYNGRLLCGMAGFKAHAIFGFWQGGLIEGVSPNRNDGGEAMGNFGKLTSVKDLPSKRDLTTLIKRATKLHDDGVIRDSAEEGAQARGEGARRADGRVGEEPAGRRAVQGISAEPSPRVHRVDRRGEARRDEEPARRAGGRVDRRGQGAELEVPVAPMTR